MVVIEISLNLGQQSYLRDALRNEPGDIGTTTAGQNAVGHNMSKERSPSGDFFKTDGICGRGETPRYKAAHIRFDGCDVLLARPLFRRVRLSAPAAVLFVHERNDSDRPPGPKAEFLQHSHCVDTLNHTGTVVMSSLPFVPAVQMSSYHNNFIRNFRAFQFSDDICRLNIRECFG